VSRLLNKLLEPLRARAAPGSPLRISATRHPNPQLAGWLLVSVEDDAGPVTGLTNANFVVHVWARTTAGPAGGPGLAYNLGFDQVNATVGSQPNGFYELDVAALPGTSPTEEDPGTASQTPEELGALVYAVIVLRHMNDIEQRGEAIAVTPVGY
jgi:hypothetical protein